MPEEMTHRVTITLEQGFEFRATFDGASGTSVVLDEPPPLGGGRGPNAAALLSAAVGNCLAASLLFCLRKSRATVGALTADVTTRITRNEAGRFRISGIDVALSTDVSAEDLARLGRCEDLFEDYCIVTESVRRGIPVSVSVAEPRGAAA
jgi:uncharacterized OsmC-like protein